MDFCLSYTTNPSYLQPLSSPSNPRRSIRPFGVKGHRRPFVVLASGAGNRSGLSAPLELKSAAGKSLSSALLNDRESFHVAVQKQLEKLAADKDEAAARMSLSLGSDEACLHRRIAELKERECQTAVEDVMYMFIISKFSEIRVHLVPRLSRCIYNGRMEICPSKDWELESIHSFEVREMIREHLTTVVGWRANSSITDAWTTTKIQRLHLCRVYATSILYGYFLKSALLRHHLEESLGPIQSDLGIKTGSHLPLSEPWTSQLKNITFGRFCSIQTTSVGEAPRSRANKQGSLKQYVTGFDPETVKMCAKPRSKEAFNLIERHSWALFGDGRTGLLGSDEVICTSYASMKRFVLEAIAFGSFLWDAEEYVGKVYKLGDDLLE